MNELAELLKAEPLARAAGLTPFIWPAIAYLKDAWLPDDRYIVPSALALGIALNLGAALAFGGSPAESAAYGLVSGCAAVALHSGWRQIKKAPVAP